MICGGDKTYSKRYYIEVNENLKKLTAEEWKDWVREVFVESDADALIAWRDSAEQSGNLKLPLDFATQNVQTPQTSILSDDVIQFRGLTMMEYLNDYGGNPKLDSVDIQTSVNTELVFTLVYNPKEYKYYHPNNEDPVHNGFTTINYQLRKLRENYALDLIQKLNLKGVPSYRFNHDESFTNFINTVLLKAQSELLKQSYRKSTIDPETRVAFVKLACFDELLLNSKFVGLNSSTRIDFVFGKDRYTFTGERIDFGRDMYGEHADSEDYTSKLVKIILGSIDCLYAEDGDPTGTKLGLEGFQYAMSEVIEAAMSGKDPVLFDLLTDDKNCNFETMIDHYLATRGGRNRKTRQALYGIRAALFNDKVPTVIKQMFDAQAMSVVKAIYVEYSYGTLEKNGTKRPAIVAKDAMDKVVDQIKRKLLDRLTTKIEIHQDKPRLWEALKTKLKISENQGIISFNLPGMKDPVTFKYNTNSKKFEFLNNPYRDQKYNGAWMRLLQQTLDLPVSDLRVWEQALSESGLKTTSIFTPFEQMFGAFLWSINSRNKTIPWMKDGKLISNQMYTFVDSAASFMNNVTTNEFKVVVKDQNGNNIPAYQMVSLAYRTPYLIRKIMDDIRQGKQNPKQGNLVVEYKNALEATELRESIEVGGTVKGVQELSANEALSLSMFVDYLQKFEGDEVKVAFQPMIYSDKTRHILKLVNLSAIAMQAENGRPVLLSKTLAALNTEFGFVDGSKNKSVSENEDLLCREIMKRRFSEAKITLENKLSRFAQVYGIENYQLLSTTELLEKVNSIIATKSLDQIIEDFRSADVDFYIENDVDAVVNASGKKVGSQINQMLVFTYETFSTLEGTKAYLERMKIESAIDLIEGGFRINRFLDPYLKYYYDHSLKGSEKSKWINSNSGDMQLFKIRTHDGKEVAYRSGMTVDEIAEIGTIEFAPVINGYFYANALVSEQIRTIQMGSDYSIAGKGNSVEENISERFIAQSKRAMGQGSTIMKFDTTRTFGVGSSSLMASVEDIRRMVRNPQGASKNERINDGNGYMSPEQFILETWSVPGNVAPRGDVVKSIMQFVDSEGSLEQVKWAADVISNLRMRGADGDGISLREMYRLTHNEKINIENLNIQDFYGPYVHTNGGHTITCTEKLYYKDNEEGTYWRIDSVEKVGPNTIRRNITQVTADGKPLGVTTYNDIEINSIYDLFQLFGAEWCMTMDHSQGTLDYSEINHYILANIICVHNWKDKFVGYVVNTSAYKVGAKNVNPSDIFENPNYRLDKFRKSLRDYFKVYPDRRPKFIGEDLSELSVLSENTLVDLCNQYGLDSRKLWTFKFDLSHSGWQLDAGHEVKDGHVTEMSQLVSLLIEKGYCTDIVAEIYNNIAAVTKAGLEKFQNADRLKEIISEILIDSLSGGSSNIVSITDDFIKQLQIRSKEEGVPLEIPFSSPSILSKFASSICASINRAALRRKYAGLGTVQTASVGQMCTSSIGGFDFTYEEVCDLYRPSLKRAGLTIQDLFVDRSSHDSKNIVTEEYLQTMLGVKTKIETYDVGSYEVSAIEQIHPSDIRFQDTILIPQIKLDFDGNPILRLDGNPQLEYKIVRIHDISTRDRYKHLLKGFPIYRWNTRSRDLVQQLSEYQTEDGRVWDIYDFDESRLIFYLGYSNEWQKWTAEEQVLIKQFILDKTGHNFDDLALNKGLLAAELKKAQNELQERLIRLDEGNNRVYIDGIEWSVEDGWNKGADIMVGNAFFEKFGMTHRDGISKVLQKGPKFFAEKLAKKYSFMEVSDVPPTQYDAILYTADGEKILIQFGDNPERNTKNTYKSNYFTSTPGKLRYKGEDLGSSEGITEFTYKGGSGNYYKVLQLSDVTALNRIQKSKMFSEVRYKISHKSDFLAFCKLKYSKFVDNEGVAKRNFRIGKFTIKAGSDVRSVFTKYASEIIPALNAEMSLSVQRKFERLAEKQYVAFKRAIECVGTRIPSQALQSCAKCRIIGFTGSKSNDVYVPQTLTWVAGSDYDIDKFFIMMFDIMSDGTLPNLSGISNPYFDPVDLGKLPKSLGKEFEINISNGGVSFDNEVVVTKAEIEAVNAGDFNTLYNIISKLTPDSEIVLVDPELELSEEGQLALAMTGVSTIDVTDIKNRNYRYTIEDFFETINEWSLNDISKYAKFYRDAAERNQVVSSITRALSENSVQLALQNQISMDDANDAAEKTQTSVKSLLNNDNIYSRFKQQEDNMVGKIGIASVAVAQKAFNGISFSFNYMAQELSDEFEHLDLNDSDAFDQWWNKLEQISIKRKDGSYMSLANINFRKLIRSLRNRALEARSKGGLFEYNYKRALDRVIQLNENSNKTDAVNLFSNIMSAATDNAKELLLARLNAIGDNLDLYTYLFATGHSFIEAAEKINSSTFRFINKWTKRNIFELGSERITLQGVLDFFQDKDYLPTVNKNIIKSIFKDGIDKRGINPNSFLHILLTNPFYGQKFVNLVNEVTGSKFETLAQVKSALITAGSTIASALSEKVPGGKITYIEQFQIKCLEDETARELFTGENGWLTKQIASKSTAIRGDFDENDNPEDDPDYESKVSSYNYKYESYKTCSADDLRRVYDYTINKLYIKQDSMKDINESELKDFVNLNKKASEFAILGRKIFSINQGMRVGNYEEYSWVNGIEASINRLFYDAFSAKKQNFAKFDFIRFMQDDVYAEYMCKQYDRYIQLNPEQSTLNILRVLRNSPHYKAMIESAFEARRLIESSYVAKKTRDIAKQMLNGISSNSTWRQPILIEIGKDLSGQSINVEIVDCQNENSDPEICTRTLSSKEFNKITECVNEHMVLNFFTHLDDSVSIPVKGSQISHVYDISKETLKLSTFPETANRKIQFNTIDGLATFKLWMDEFFIPKLKEHLTQSEANTFADYLVQTKVENDTYGTKKYVWNIDSDIRLANPGDNLYAKKSSVVAEFNKIIQNPISMILGEGYQGIRMSVGDLLYLYNLYTFKGSNRGFDFLFSDAAITGGRSEWVNNYQRYIKQIDYDNITGKLTDEKGIESEELFNITVEDIVSKVINSENAWKFNCRFNWSDKTKPDIVIDSYHKLDSQTRMFSFHKPLFLGNSDVTFEIQSAYKTLRKSEWSGFDPYEYFTIGADGAIKNRKIKASSSEIMRIIIENLNSILKASGITINEFTNEDIKQWIKTNSPLVSGMSVDELTRLKSSRGFVSGGNVYINVSETIEHLNENQEDPIFPKILVHELVHIIAANLHYNPRFKNTYGKIITRLWDLADNETKEYYKKQYPNKKTTDLKEEYFADYIANGFNSRLFETLETRWNNIVDGVPTIEDITFSQLQYDIKQSLKEIFALDGKFENVDFSKVLGSDVSQIVGMFNSALFDFSELGFNANVVELSQGLATIKNNLFNENKIIEDCK